MSIVKSNTFFYAVRRKIPVWAALFFFLIMLFTPAVLKPASGDQLTDFLGAGETVSVPFGAGGGTDSSVKISIEKDNIIHSALLNISGNDFGLRDDPLNPTLNVGDDADTEWAYNGQYYGKLGRQDLFNASGASQTKTIPSGSSQLDPVLIPRDAVVTSATVSIRGDQTSPDNLSAPSPSLTGDLANTAPFNSAASSYRWQAVYDASYMGGKSGVVDRLFIRQRGAIPSNGIFNNCKMYLSHTTRTKDNLSATFANNRDSSFTQVWPSGGGSASLNMKNDGAVIFELADLEDLFFYDGTHNLLLEVEWSTTSGTIQSMEADTSLGRVWSANSASATGTAESQYGLCMAFLMVGSLPSDVTLDIGDDGGAPEFSSAGPLSTTSQPVPDFAASMNTWLNTLPPAFTDAYGNKMVEVPFHLESASKGGVTLEDLVIDYDYSCNVDFTSELSSLVPAGSGNITIYFAVSSQSAGVIALSGLDIQFTPSNLPPSSLFIPSTYSVMEGSGYQELFDSSDYFTDDHKSPWELTYSIENQTPEQSADCTLVEDRFLYISMAKYPDFYGKFQLVLRATDDKGKWALSNAFNVTVTPINDWPVINNTPPKTTMEDETLAVWFNASDPDSEQLEWTLSGNAYWVHLGFNTGILTGLPTNDEVGEYTLYINVSDTEGGTDSIKFTLEVVNVNDPPEALEPFGEFQMIEDNPVSLDLNDWFSDVDSSFLEFRGDSDNENLSFTFHSNGTVEIIPAPDWQGYANTTFIANDSKAETGDDFLIRVSGVDDVPKALEITLEEWEYKEGGPQPAWAAAADGDLPFGDHLNYSWSSNVSGQIGYGEYVNLSLPGGLHEVTLTVTDSTNLFELAMVKIYITPPPPPPVNNTDVNDTKNHTVEDTTELWWEANGLYLLAAGIILALIILLVVVAVVYRVRTGKTVEKEPEVVDAEVSSDDVFKDKEDLEKGDPADVPDVDVMPPMDGPDMASPDAVSCGASLEELTFEEDAVMTVWEEGSHSALPLPENFDSDFEEGKTLDELFILNSVGAILYNYSYSGSSVKDRDLLASIATVVGDGMQESAWKPFSSKEVNVGKMSVLLLHGEHVLAVAVSTSGTAKFFEKSLNRFVHELESVNEDLLADDEGMGPPQTLIGVPDCVIKLVHRGY